MNGLFALGGVAVGAIPAVITAWLKNRSHERRHLREQSLQIAIEAWRFRAEHADAIQPLEHQVVFSSLLSQLASEDGLTPERVRIRLAEISAIVDVLAEDSASKTPIRSRRTA